MDASYLFVESTAYTVAYIHVYTVLQSIQFCQFYFHKSVAVHKQKHVLFPKQETKSRSIVVSTQFVHGHALVFIMASNKAGVGYINKI